MSDHSRTPQHLASVTWLLAAGDDFRSGKYSRKHEWSFDGGLTVPGSPSPHVVREPYSDPSAVDPEEAFVAAIASCHLLTFLYLASKAGFVVESYEDRAVGSMTKNERRVAWVSRVELRPKIVFSAARIPSAEELQDLHERSHEECFIANSVKTEIVVVSE